MARQTNPFDDVQRMFDQLRRQIGELPQMEGAMEGGRLSVDVEDRGDDIVVTADVPGCETDDLDVSVTEDTLRITADYEEATEDRGANYVRRERSRRRAARSIDLPEAVDEDAAAATCKNGVLTITLPKLAPEESGRSIEIE